MEKGYNNVKVVDGGWTALAKQGFPLVDEGKIVWPKKK